MGAADLDRRLLEHLRDDRLFPEPGLALLAVSGGLDSVVLLDLFSVVGGAFGLSLAVAHVDHGILPASAAVAAQVAEVARRYGLPAAIERLALGPEASETRARRARYHALRRVQGRLGARYLVTAHQADDQVETVLLRLLRGSGPAGLAGMAATGPDGLVRPLLPFHRRDLAAWLEARFPDPRTRPPVHQDPSNWDPRHDRSWLRVEVLPRLRARWGEELDRRLLALAWHAGRERAAWAGVLRQLPGLGFRRDAAGRWVEVAVEPLLQGPPELGEALLGALAREVGWVLGPARAARLLGFLRRAGSGRRVELGEGWLAAVAFGRVRLERASLPLPPAPQVLELAGAGEVLWGEWWFRWWEEPAGALSRGGWSTWVEAGPAVVRAVRRGDRLVPLGGVGHRPVRRLLMEARVRRSDRAGYPVLEREGQLLWVPGICRAALGLPAVGAAAVRVEAGRAGAGVGVVPAGG